MPTGNHLMNPIFVILKESGISGNCILGEGATEKAAWEDAYGPKPWTPYTKKSAKSAWVVQMTEEGLAQAKDYRNSL